MAELSSPYICPKQLLELPAYRQANNPTRAKMVGFCTLLCISGGLYGEFVQLPSSSLERFLSLKGFKTIRNAIATIIECDEHFSYRKEGHRKALGYRFTPQISAADFVAVQQKTKSGQQFSEPSEQMYRPDVFVSGNLLPVHQKLFHCLSKFTIDAPNLPRALESLPFVKQVIATWNAQKWMRGDFFFIVGETGRVYSSGSNLKRETRSILLVNGEPVVEIDVSCCQPVLLSFLMKGYISDAEHQEFASLTQSGLLYDEIASASNNSRENVKKALVKWLCGPWFLDGPFIDFDMLALLSEDDRKEKLELHDSLTKVNQWFKVRFPDICEYMRSEKTNDEYYRLFNTAERRDAGRSTQPYAVIAHKLQRLESQIIIKDCCASLFETYPSLPILTAHDSLIVPESMKEQVFEQMTKSFMKSGLKPRITIKRNNNVRGREKSEEQTGRGNV